MIEDSTAREEVIHRFVRDLELLVVINWERMRKAWTLNQE